MPNSTTAAEDVLLGIVTTAWAANTPAGTPLLYNNLDSDRPNPPALFGRAVVRESVGGYAGVGTTRMRRPGTLFIQLFVPQGAGTKTINDLSNALVNALKNASVVTLDGIRLRDIGSNELGSDGVYHQVNVQASFEYDTN